jgi:hypothetical protein
VTDLAFIATQDRDIEIASDATVVRNGTHREEGAVLVGALASCSAMPDTHDHGSLLHPQATFGVHSGCG